MSNHFQATQWHTARALHQIQLLSCDFTRLRSWKSPDLCAPFWRLYWHDAPGGFVVVSGETIRIPARRFVLIPPNTHFASGNTAAFGQLFLHFLLEPGLARSGPALYQLEPDPELNRLASDLKKALLADSTDLRVSLRGQALLSLALLQIPREAWSVRYGDARITEAVTTLRSNYPARTSNAALARKAGLHPGAFRRLFRQVTGETTGGFLANLRMEEACVLLQTSELTIDEVAEKTGFCDRAYFSKIFTRRMGLSPAKYRKLVNSDNRLRR